MTSVAKASIRKGTSTVTRKGIINKMKLIHATTVAGHSASLDISVYMNRYIHVPERNLLHVIGVTSALVDYIISKSIKKKFMLVKGLLPVMSVT